MRTWKRADVAHLCGRCGQTIAASAPMQVIELPQTKRRLFRCAACADAAVPDLPVVSRPVVEIQPSMKAPKSFRQTFTSDDWKQRAGGR